MMTMLYPGQEAGVYDKVGVHVSAICMHTHTHTLTLTHTLTRSLTSVGILRPFCIELKFQRSCSTFSPRRLCQAMHASFLATSKFLYL